VAGPAAGAVPAAALLDQLVLAAARVARAAFFELFTWAAFLAAAPAFTAARAAPLADEAAVAVVAGAWRRGR